MARSAARIAAEQYWREVAAKKGHEFVCMLGVFDEIDEAETPLFVGEFVMKDTHRVDSDKFNRMLLQDPRDEVTDAKEIDLVITTACYMYGLDSEPGVRPECENKLVCKLKSDDGFSLMSVASAAIEAAEKAMKFKVLYECGNMMYVYRKPGKPSNRFYIYTEL